MEKNDKILEVGPDCGEQLLLRPGSAILHFTMEYETVKFVKKQANFWTIADIDTSLSWVKESCKITDWDLNACYELGMDELPTIPLENVKYDADVAIVLYVKGGQYFILTKANGIHISDIPVPEDADRILVMLRKHSAIYEM